MGARKTAAEKAAEAEAAAAAEAADRAKADADLEIINQFEEDEGRPPNSDELAQRRAARATAEADRALEEEMGGHTEPGGSGSISERAANGGGDPGEDDEGQTFLYMGEEVTLGTLLKRVKVVEHAWKFTGKREKGKGALPKLDGDVHLIVRSKPASYKVVPTRDDQEQTEKAVIEVQIAPKVIHHAATDEGQQMMAELLRARGWTVEPPQVAATG